MVEPWVGAQVVQGAARSCPWVARAVDESADAGGYQGACAHGTGFERHDDRHLREPPAPHEPGRVTEDEHLGMGGGILCALALVVAGCDDPPTNQGDGTDGHLPGPRGDPRLGESDLHSVVVAQLRRTVCGGDAPGCEVLVSPR